MTSSVKSLDKRRLANRIWESANKLRSKIEANEYKDYILGFIFYKFPSDREEQFARAQGKTVVHIHNSDLQDLTIMLPSLSEQRKIGAFFRTIDELLAARRQEVAKLRELKKTLLQRMFV